MCWFGPPFRSQFFWFVWNSETPVCIDFAWMNWVSMICKICQLVSLCFLLHTKSLVSFIWSQDPSFGQDCGVSPRGIWKNKTKPEGLGSTFPECSLASSVVACVLFFVIPRHTLGFVTLVTLDRLVDMEVMLTTRQGCDQSYCASWHEGSDCRRHGAESIEISSQK